MVLPEDGPAGTNTGTTHSPVDRQVARHRGLRPRRRRRPVTGWAPQMPVVPSKSTRERVRLAAEWMEEGASDREVAARFRVTRTLNRPGIDGGFQPPKDGSHGGTAEIPRRAA